METLEEVRRSVETLEKAIAEQSAALAFRKDLLEIMEKHPGACTGNGSQGGTTPTAATKPARKRGRKPKAEAEAGKEGKAPAQPKKEGGASTTVLFQELLHKGAYTRKEIAGLLRISEGYVNILLMKNKDAVLSEVGSDGLKKYKLK